MCVGVIFLILRHLRDDESDACFKAEVGELKAITKKAGQNGVAELKMTNLMERCGKNNGAQKNILVGNYSQQHREGPHVVARALRNRRVSSNQQNPPNCRNLGPK